MDEDDPMERTLHHAQQTKKYHNWSNHAWPTNVIIGIKIRREVQHQAILQYHFQICNANSDSLHTKNQKENSYESQNPNVILTTCMGCLREINGRGGAFIAGAVPAAAAAATARRKVHATTNMACLLYDDGDDDEVFLQTQLCTVSFRRFADKPSAAFSRYIYPALLPSSHLASFSSFSLLHPWLTTTMI